jgi:hypothetical protein
MEITIFYSWQSDSKFNRKAILDAIRLAIIDVEKFVPGLHIKIEEASSNEVGALHIPNNILQNITKADIFIGDLSIVGQSFESKDGKFRQIANPNVLIELGYAIAELTWNRIIILFNKDTGEFPNGLPFDIEKRSCLDFAVKMENDTNGVGQLRVELTKRILAIVEKKPVRNLKSRNQTELKERAQDVKTVTFILNLFRTRRMDHLIQHGHSRIERRTPRKIEDLNSFISSKQFFLYDTELRSRIFEFKKKLNDVGELLRKQYSGGYGHDYENNVNELGKAKKGALDPTRFDSAKAVMRELDREYSNLITYLRLNYHEINFDDFFDWEDDA